MYNVSPMFDALAERFDDAYEIKDVASYGCAAGVSGFIYYRETCAFYDEHEDEILDYLSDYDISIKDVCEDEDTIDQLKNRLVWCTVEQWCADQLDREETALSV